ncbi:aminoacyl-histidine dipeptidase [Haloimpatiens lingqiaonensis]|uniref:aminoacyl-histidine dipeptidase n=1 Tax=Haloimpatiens lingqiaonensis TaxID=1380675 RepID=UPI0010FD0A1A|nr:aminoacyl-histidine dipeptidase [Haloimpatiens lingqiaonensis]
MSRVLDNLNPKEVFFYFEELSKIPRGSGDEKRVSDYLVSFAKENNLEVIQDETLNVIIKKPGTKGYENAPTVVIQGHMDMVCAKEPGLEHDFTKDPLKIKVEGDFVRAEGTTLGADDGIAVAYGLAVLAASDIPHPPIELLVTTDEETGMGGAQGLDPANVNGRLLLNIDSEEEGKLLVSCAGGLRDKITLPVVFQNAEGLKAVEVKVHGLKGGHSGMEINKGRGNANKLMGRFLNELMNSMDLRVAAINGGEKDNAIPRQNTAVVLVKEEEMAILQQKVNEFTETFKKELETADKDVIISLNPLNEKIEKVFSKDTLEKAINILILIPNSVQTMSMAIEGLVESSSNIGVVNTLDNSIEFVSATRSSVDSLKEEIHLRAAAIAKAYGAEIETFAPYPAWQYRADSKLREVCVEAYEEMYGEKPEIAAIHAGLECGLFSGKFHDMDMISFGPNMYDVHTPQEHISISSTERVWKYLLEVLKRIK